MNKRNKVITKNKIMIAMKIKKDIKVQETKGNI